MFAGINDQLHQFSWAESESLRRIVPLDDNDMIIEHKIGDKHQNADSLSKKTEFLLKLTGLK